MRQARISWFGTNQVRRIFSVSKGFVCRSWSQGDSLIRQISNAVVITMHLSPSERVFQSHTNRNSWAHSIVKGLISVWRSFLHVGIQVFSLQPCFLHDIGVSRKGCFWLSRSSKHADVLPGGWSWWWWRGGGGDAGWPELRGSVLSACQAKGLSDLKMQASVSWQPLPFMCSVWLSML